ncbi:hypothetical protein SAMN04487760_10840 [Lachnospiraceae bacterium G41]|nr:hypothetical protein SAMN04487760_10840 [Lachnospiraceae bacterium G41]
MTKQKLIVLLGALALVTSFMGCSLLPSKDNTSTTVSKIEADPVKDGEKTTVDTTVDPTIDTTVDPTIDTTVDIDEGKDSNSTADYKDLEEYFSNPLNKWALEAMSNSSDYENIFSNVEVEVKGNRMIYKFTSVTELATNIEDTMQANANAAKGQLFANIRSMVDTEGKMEIEYIYFNPDGTQVADIILYEDDADDTSGYESSADKGTVQYYYESTFGPDYWNNSVDALLEQYGDTCTDIKIECVGNTVSSYYYLAADIGDAQEAIESGFDEESKKQLIDQVKVPSGVKDPVTVEYFYINPDGSIAAEISFEG